jgi:hypothetical protein
VSTKPENAIANALVDDMAMKCLEVDLTIAAGDVRKGYHPEVERITSLEEIADLVRLQPTSQRRPGARMSDMGDAHDGTQFSGSGLILSRSCTEFDAARDAAGFFLYTCSKNNRGSTAAGGGIWPSEANMSAYLSYPPTCLLAHRVKISFPIMTTVVLLSTSQAA